MDDVGAGANIVGALTANTENDAAVYVYMYTCHVFFFTGSVCEIRFSCVFVI